MARPDSSGGGGSQGRRCVGFRRAVAVSNDVVSRHVEHYEEVAALVGKNDSQISLWEMLMLHASVAWTAVM